MGLGLVHRVHLSRNHDRLARLVHLNHGRDHRNHGRLVRQVRLTLAQSARLVHLNRPKRRRGTKVRSLRPAIEENVTNDDLEWWLAKSTDQTWQ